MIISYELGDSLYLNITNRCGNACEFCLRDGQARQTEDWSDSSDLLGTNDLWLDHEPTLEEIFDDLSGRDITKYNEIVFCGFGEPFERFDDCVIIAKWLKERGVTVRVNTNGQVNLIQGTDVTEKMNGLFDTVSISLNAVNAVEYQRLCHSVFGEQAYNSLLDFSQKCANRGINVVMTVVSTIGKEKIGICRQIASEHGATLRVRQIIE